MTQSVLDFVAAAVVYSLAVFAYSYAPDPVLLTANTALLMACYAVMMASR